MLGSSNTPVNSKQIVWTRGRSLFHTTLQEEKWKHRCPSGENFHHLPEWFFCPKDFTIRSFGSRPQFCKSGWQRSVPVGYKVFPAPLSLDRADTHPTKNTALRCQSQQTWVRLLGADAERHVAEGGKTGLIVPLAWCLLGSKLLLKTLHSWPGCPALSSSESDRQLPANTPVTD